MGGHRVCCSVVVPGDDELVILPCRPWGWDRYHPLAGAVKRHVAGAALHGAEVGAMVGV